MQESTPEEETDDEGTSKPEDDTGVDETYETKPTRKSREERKSDEAAEIERERKDLLDKKAQMKAKKIAERQRVRKQKELNNEKKRLLQVLDKVVADIDIMTSVVQSQIQILQDLREVYQVSFRERSQRTTASTVRVPVITRHKEQIRAAVETAGVVIEGRKAFCKSLDDLLKDFKKIHGSVLSPTPSLPRIGNANTYVDPR